MVWAEFPPPHTLAPWNVWDGVKQNYKNTFNGSMNKIFLYISAKPLALLLKENLFIYVLFVIVFWLIWAHIENASTYFII